MSILNIVKVNPFLNHHLQLFLFLNNHILKFKWLEMDTTKIKYSLFSFFIVILKSIFEYGENAITIGRKESCDLVLKNDNIISNVQCSLWCLGKILK